MSDKGPNVDGRDTSAGRWCVGGDSSVCRELTFEDGTEAGCELLHGDTANLTETFFALMEMIEAFDLDDQTHYTDTQRRALSLARKAVRS